MIYRAQVPDCRESLDRILDFQEQLLRYCTEHGSYVPNELEAILGPDVFRWLGSTPARQRILDRLKNFIGHQEDVRINILEEFQHDREFPARSTDDTYQLGLKHPDTIAQDDLKRMLTDFYEQLTRGGFPSQICDCDTQCFTSNDWWEGFKRNNPNLITCPICDSTLSIGRSIDHFFPKGKYLAVSVHPYNLIPSCVVCNNIKGDRDPINGFKFSQVNLPYESTIIDDVQLTFHEDINGSNVVEFEYLTSDPLKISRIKNFEYLYEIPSRWANQIPEIAEIAIGLLKIRISFECENGQTLSEEMVRRSIDCVIERLRKDRGKNHYYFPATEWLCYAKEEKFNLLFEEMKRHILETQK